jgi:hypothetical protein
MHMNRKDQFILILNNIEKNSSMVNWKELNKQKLKLNKSIKIIKKEINKILLYGKQPNLDNQLGIPNGVKVDLVGILNALRWLVKYLVKS